MVAAIKEFENFVAMLKLQSELSEMNNDGLKSLNEWLGDTLNRSSFGIYVNNDDMLAWALEEYPEKVQEIDYYTVEIMEGEGQYHDLMAKYIIALMMENIKAGLWQLENNERLTKIDRQRYLTDVKFYQTILSGQLNH